MDEAINVLSNNGFKQKKVSFSNYYVIDLETTTDKKKVKETKKEQMLEEEAVFISALMYAPINSTCDNIEQFYGKSNAEDALLDLPSGIYYAWNGARFDSYFIYHLLRNAGYSKQEETKNTYSKKKQLRKFEYSYLISGSRFISLTFRNENGIVEVYDACLLYTSPLASFINNTCPEFPKLEETDPITDEPVFDYHKYRLTENDFTEKEKDYCRGDIKGFAIGMYRVRIEFYEKFQMDILESFTAGSFAMKYAKREIEATPNLITAQQYEDMDIELNGADKKGKKRNNGKVTKRTDILLSVLFPEVNFRREYVIGGRTFANPIHLGKILECITKIDAKSFYPSMMVNSKLPYGKMSSVTMNSEKLKQYLKDYPDRYVFARLVEGVVRYDDMYSPITILDKDGVRDYPTEAGASDGVFLDDNILRDPKLINNKNIFQCSIFDSKIGIFEYMRKVYGLKNKFKKEGKKGLELAVKIILNSTYGKFLQRELVDEKDFFDGMIGVTGVKKTLTGWHLYAPMGAAITANCRYLLTQFMNLLKERFIYCDTDSLVFYGETPKEIPLGFELGEWEEEATPTGLTSIGTKCPKSGQFIVFQRKTYAMELEKFDKKTNQMEMKTEITFCGVPKKAVEKVYPEKQYPNGVPISKLLEDMTRSEHDNKFGFDVLQSTKTKSGVLLIEKFIHKQFRHLDKRENSEVMIDRAAMNKYTTSHES